MTLGHDPVGFVAELGPGALLGNRLMNVDAGHVGGPIGRPHASLPALSDDRDLVADCLPDATASEHPVAA